MQSLLPHLPMEAQPAPPPPAPEPISNSNAEALPLPPCFLELVKQQAERTLPSKACTPMLLQRANMLLQDAVDAACMCMRAHVDSPTLLKHILGAEHYNVFLRDDDKVRALDLAEEDGGPTTIELNAWSSLVTEHVGEVGPPPWGRRPPPPTDALPPPPHLPYPAPPPLPTAITLQAFAPTLGAVLELICDSLLESILKQLEDPTPGASSSSQDEPAARTPLALTDGSAPRRTSRRPGRSWWQPPAGLPPPWPAAFRRPGPPTCSCRW